jgi:hypothetical protein
LIAGAAAITAIACFVAARVVRPSIRRTARLVDARAALDDRLVTALQFMPPEDAAAALILRHASASAASIDPAALFRFERPRGLRAWLLAAPLVPLMLVWSGSADLSKRASSVPAGHSTAGGASPDARVKTGTTPGTARREDAGAAAGPEQNAATAAMKSAASRGSNPANTDEAAGIASAASMAAGSGRTQAAAKPESRSDSASASSSGRAVAAGRGSFGAGTRGPTGSRGGAGGSDRSLTRGAGGIAGGTTEFTALDPGRGSPGNASYAARYRAAARAAETAIARERIPADRRAHVKNYFVAIRPGER